MYRIIITHVPSGTEFWSPAIPHEGNAEYKSRKEVEKDYAYSLVNDDVLIFIKDSGNKMFFHPLFLRNCTIEFENI
jgi:hypothetical protein